jgi:hypothetical protein
LLAQVGHAGFDLLAFLRVADQGGGKEVRQLTVRARHP